MSVIIRFRERRFLEVCEHIGRSAPTTYAVMLKRPVFLIGVPRSGTSLLLHMLINHPDITGFNQEANHLWHPHVYPWRKLAAAQTIPPYEQDPRAFTKYSLSLTTNNDIDLLKATFGAAQYLADAKVVLNKSAMLCFMLPQLVTWFPDAKFIHLVRDGRAVAFSRATKEHAKMTQHSETYIERGFWRNFSDLLGDVAIAWTESLFEVQRTDQELGLTDNRRMLTLKYEDLCADPEAVIRTLFRFIELEHDVKLPAFDTKNQNQKYQQALDANQRSHVYALTKKQLDVFGYQ